jgi:hypothetical protein
LLDKRVPDNELTASDRERYPSLLMPLQIPGEYLPAIGKILKLSDASAHELINALSSATIRSEASEMAETIADHAPNIPRQDLTDIVDALYSLYHVREFSRRSAPHGFSPT